MTETNRHRAGPPTDPDGVTRLLKRCAAGSDEAFGQLIELVYDDLRGIAHRRLQNERAGHTLDTTALVHEAYLKLLPQAETSWGDRAHFFAVASRVVRHVLIDYARRKKADKRSGGVRVPLRESTAATRPSGDVDILALERALARLAERDPRLEKVVECRFFGGMTVPETAEALGVSTSTVDRDWARARTYLYEALMPEGGTQEALGRGGMATVYLVERADGVYEHTAALKLLRRGLDTSDIVRRVRAERQILSSLQHPNISRLLDGGATEDGRPFLVMERVDGVPITEWCDACGASIEQRLELFVDVARAVHHAHTRLVVHRDLKPSNILVTPAGRVKLLDFGIAKILDPDLDPASRIPTRSGRRALTPEYASPEQVRGDVVTTATDVYQLGLLLHRLLTGARPREARGTTARLAEDPTPTPSTPSRLTGRADPALAATRDCTPDGLARRLRGDLDAIVLAAFETEPEDRYPSALAMAEDVERNLQGRPITARPAGRLYRARKFMARHRWLAPVAVAACAVLGLYIGTLLHHGNQLEAERNAARRQAERAEHVRDVLVGVFQGADPWSAEEPRRVSEAGLAEALDIGAERARTELGEDPGLQAELYASMAEVYIGLGRPDRARGLLEDALERRRDVLGPRSAEVAAAAFQLGRVYNLQNRHDTATALLRASLEIARARPDVPDSTSVRAIIELGDAERGLGHDSEAERLLLQATEAAAGAYPDLVARAYQDLARLYPRLDRPDDAIRFAELAYELKARSPRLRVIPRPRSCSPCSRRRSGGPRTRDSTRPSPFRSGRPGR